MSDVLTPDLLVIGAGPAGYRAADYAARQGLQVVVAEEGEAGGTCLNRGCIPTKTYVHADTFSQAVERQQQVVAQLRAGVEAILAAPGIRLLRGHAAFHDDGTVGVAPDVIVRPCHVIIATGSHAKLPPIPDIKTDPRVVTSTGLLRMNRQPHSLCIVGAGVIGMEFASVFCRFGTQVTVVEVLRECLPMLDSDIAKRLRKLMETQGVTFHMKTPVLRLADIDADTILIATGRQANTQGLQLAAAGIHTDERGFIPVDDNYRVASSAISCYAVGDVNGCQLLAHAAEMQALHAVNHIVGRSDGIRFDVIPAAIFTHPEAACVGPSEQQLKEQGASYKCRKAFWRANGKALAMGKTEGMLKLFSDVADRIVGCHAFGPHAADLVQEASVLICRDTTVSQLRDMVHIHPTLGEVLRTAAEAE